MSSSRRRFGPLEAIEFKGDPSAPAVVLLHGYGADAADLAPLNREVFTGRPLTWLFPDAPQPMASGPFAVGRSWFPLDERKLHAAQMTGRPLDTADEEPRELADAASAVAEAVAAAGFDLSEVVLGGFSQGAMVATQLALQAPKAPRGLVILSGNPIHQTAWRKMAPSRKGLPFFQSHGTFDPVLGFEGALRLERLLREAGLKGELTSFEGGHMIGPEVLEGLGKFLDSL